MRHDCSLEYRSHRVAALVVGRVVREVLNGITLKGLQDICLRDSIENRNLLRAEGDNGYWVRCTDMPAQGVLVRNVRGNLQRGNSKTGQGKSADGYTPDSLQEVLMGRGFIADWAKKSPRREYDIVEVGDGVVYWGRSVTSRNEPRAWN